MSADDRYPHWIRVNSDDMTSEEGRYILGGKSTQEWADYGRYFALMQLLARTTGARLHVKDERLLKSLSVDLSMTPKACVSWLDMLGECGAINPLDYAEGYVTIDDVTCAVLDFQDTVRRNKRNGAKGGRPRKTETKPSG